MTEVEKRRKPFEFYHGTTTRFLPNILKHGLKADPGHKSYGSPEMPSFGGVYLTTDYRIAVESAEEAAERWGGFPVIVRIFGYRSGTIPDEDALINMIHHLVSCESDTDRRVIKTMNYLRRHFTTNRLTEKLVRELFDILEAGMDKNTGFWDWLYGKENAGVRHMIDRITRTLKNRNDNDIIDRFRVTRDISFRGPLRIVGVMVPYTREEIEFPGFTFDEVEQKVKDSTF